MPFHLPGLHPGQGIGLQQDVVGNAHFAKIVKPGQPLQITGLILGQPEVQGHFPAMFLKSLHVTLGDIVLFSHGIDQVLDHRVAAGPGSFEFFDVHEVVGFFEKRLHIQGKPGTHSMPDGKRQVLFRVFHDMFLDFLPDPPDAGLHDFFFTAGQKHGKLISADAGDNITGSEAFFQCTGGSPQQFISFLMPQRIVDEFQAIDVTDNDAQRQAPLLGQALHFLFKKCPIVQPGQ
jgi:hypothetical protein